MLMNLTKPAFGTLFIEAYTKKRSQTQDNTLGKVKAENMEN